MQFRLVYQGPLLAEKADPAIQSRRRLHKHEIRRSFHRQLGELWRTHHILNGLQTQYLQVDRDTGQQVSASVMDNLAKSYGTHGIKWVPLVNEIWGAVCSLDILFLRREAKGRIVQTGDLDNRIKVLFDALRIPRNHELPDEITASPDREPNPFFCLLSDDSLITEFRVTADRLLVPAEDAPSELLPAQSGVEGSNSAAKVYLVIDVKTFIADPVRADLTYGSLIHKNT
jgi:hypothetical protein